MASKTKPVKVPVVLQMEALECGAASLAMVLAYYKKWVPLEEVRTACGVSRDGSNALDIIKAGQSYRLEGKGYRYSPASVRNKAVFPCIVFWSNSHFVVLDGFKDNNAFINDPGEGSILFKYGLCQKSDRKTVCNIQCLFHAPYPSDADGILLPAPFRRSGAESNVQ